jgi:hypothetical protein
LKKAKRKRASKSQMIDPNFSVIEVDKFLKEKYGYDIWNFLYSIFEMKLLYEIVDQKKEIKVIRKNINRLKSEKKKLIENIDFFMINTSAWDEMKNQYPETNIKWTPNNKNKYIIEHFNLNDIFTHINQRIIVMNRKIEFLKLYGPSITRLRISPINFIILIWSYVMTTGEKDDDVDFENIAALLNWFLVNLKLKNIFKDSSLISTNTPKLTYNKYRKYSKKGYYDGLAYYHFILCFPDIAEPLKQFFPNPIDLVKQNAEEILELSRRRFKKYVLGEEDVD